MREMLARMDSRELAEWAAFYQVEPFGEIREDLRAGIIAATTANCHRGKGGKPFEPKDFMPLIEKAGQSEDEMKRMLMRANRGN